MEYVSKLIEDKPGRYRVWSQDAQYGQNPDRNYIGPVASVYSENEWLFVVTDEHDGCAMINISTLPRLIEALQMLERHLHSQTPA